MLVDWLANGRGDALRHLGWPDLIARVATHLRTVMARAQLRDELAAIDAVLDGRVGDLDRDARVDALGPRVAAALERLPSLRPEPRFEAAQARVRELVGIELVIRALASQGPRVGASLDRALGELEDLDDSLAVARDGAVLSVVELIGVTELCRACEQIEAAFELALRFEAGTEGERTEGLRACAASLRAAARSSEGGEPAGEAVVSRCPQLLAELDRAIDREGESPRIASNASPELAAARKEVRAARQRLVANADRLLRNRTISEALRDRYWTERDGRIVLPVRSDRLGTVRSRGAIIHGSSASGQTFFVEPATLVEDNNALREAQLEAAEEQRKVLRTLSRAVVERAGTLAGMQRACIALDLLIARHRFGESYEGVAPTLVPSLAGSDSDSEEAGHPAIDLRAARHPAMLLDGVDVVPNDIVLDHGHALVVSGPNAGGKTVALKTLGVLSLLAAAGFALPCAGRPRIPVFARLITDVGDDQSIAANLSTFSAHISHVLEALRAAERAGDETLVLLDEVAVGTDPEQGAALAEAILVALVDAGATVVVTTHYDRLKLLATTEPTQARFHNAAVGFDLARLRPTFRLSLGVPGSSSAIAVARRLGMPAAVLDRAEALLGDEGVRIDELLRDIEAERQALARTRERLERDKTRLRQRDREVRSRERRVLEGVRSRKAKAYAAAVEELRGLERELKRKRRELRRAAPERVDELPTRAELAGQARADLEAHRAASEADEALVSEDLAAKLDPRKLQVGDRVWVKSMNQAGEVVSVSGKPAKKATVQLATIRTTVKVRDLAPPPAKVPRLKVKASKATPILDFKAAVEAQAASHFGEGAVPVKTSVDNVCDLRGQRFADAQDRVADFVAEAIARDQDVVLFRHGHGGGAVRKAVREALARLERVRRYRPGLSEEGGQAVTVAWLE